MPLGAPDRHRQTHRNRSCYFCIRMYINLVFIVPLVGVLVAAGVVDVARATVGCWRPLIEAVVTAGRRPFLAAVIAAANALVTAAAEITGLPRKASRAAGLA